MRKYTYKQRPGPKLNFGLIIVTRSYYFNNILNKSHIFKIYIFNFKHIPLKHLVLWLYTLYYLYFLLTNYNFLLHF